MAEIGMSINVVLMVLNLLPLPPLDGGRIAVSLLPPQDGLEICAARALRLPDPAAAAVYRYPRFAI
jgi:Zn-dependent protease